MHLFSLLTYPLAVNDSHMTDPTLQTSLQIRLDHLIDLSRLKEMEIKDSINGHFDPVVRLFI